VASALAVGLRQPTAARRVCTPSASNSERNLQPCSLSGPRNPDLKWSVRRSPPRSDSGSDGPFNGSLNDAQPSLPSALASFLRGGACHAPRPAGVLSGNPLTKLLDADPAKESSSRVVTHIR
jgi:hypothetical protein